MKQKDDTNAQNDKAKNVTRPSHQISRRVFLKGMGTMLVSTGLLSACDNDVLTNDTPPPTATHVPTSLQYTDVPYPPTTPPTANVLRFFTPHEARTIEAFTARLMPGTPDDPGAREAGVLTYIDNLLSFREGYPEVTYREPPFAETYLGDVPAPENNTYQVIWVASDQIARYGYQSVLTPREVYRMGVGYLDKHTQAEFQKKFTDLSEEEQDTVITQMLEGEVTTFEMFSAEAFFLVLRRHTAEGMFSDPAYGGNRDMVGWKLLGYPGAQRAYTPADLWSVNMVREPQSLAMLSHFHSGEAAGDEVVLPVSGSDETYDERRHQHQE